MKSLDLSQSPQEVMHHYGKSFYFASMVFSKPTAVKVFSLYQFCRYVDDCGDELDPIDGQKRLNTLVEIIDGKISEPTNLYKLVTNILDSGVKPQDLKILINGALYEAKGHHVSSKQDLIHYCYLVAGVVGKMMCPLIGVKKTNAEPYSIDMGIGMQLTNICRDVLEDHENDRYYLWELEPKFKYTSTSDSGALDTEENRAIVLKYLDLADVYYKSAFRGLSYIPFRSRVAIFVASEIYRAIGKKIRKSKNKVFYQRIYLNTFEKFWVCFKSSLKILRPAFWKSKTHESDLHIELKESLKLPVSEVLR